MKERGSSPILPPAWLRAFGILGAPSRDLYPPNPSFDWQEKRRSEGGLTIFADVLHL